jgi:flavin-binding protein dodecin
MSSENTYKVIELVGTSPESVEKAIENAIGRASQTLQHLDWFEVREAVEELKQVVAFDQLVQSPDLESDRAVLAQVQEEIDAL